MQFKKTRAWLKHIKNVLLSKYELCVEHETLFIVSINSGPEFYLIGTTKRGSFDRVLEPIMFDKCMVVECITVSHMSLHPQILYGPYLMFPGDVLQLTIV